MSFCFSTSHAGREWQCRFYKLYLFRNRIHRLESVLASTELFGVRHPFTPSLPSKTDEQQQTIKEKVKSMTDAREVELDSTIDSDIIGGVIIKVGSQVVDSSLWGQLRRLSLSLKG